MQYLVFAFVLFFGWHWSPCESTPPQQYRANLDILASDYLKTEKTLWSRINSDKEIRPNLLPEIYEAHKNILEKDFGETGVIWELGIRLHQHIIGNVLSINTTSKNLREALVSKQYANAITLAELAVNQTVDAAKALYQMTTVAGFWSHISVNISHAECTKFTTTIPTESQLLFDVYSEISAAILRSYVSVQYSYMVLTINEKENFRSKSEQYRELFKQQYTAIQNNARTLLKKADKRKWTCDKGEYISTTYHQITRFVQGYVDNEINLNPDESCKDTCSDYKQTRNYKCSTGTVCADDIAEKTSTKCNGTVLNCEFIEEDLTACPSVYKPDTRRYDYIKYSNGKTFGKDNSCLQSIQAESWHAWFFKCTNCFCYCDEESELSDRYFSLRDVVSDLSENRIVTGVSFTKRNRLIQLLISESILLPFGKINTTSQINKDATVDTYNRYVTNDEFKITDAGITDGSDYHKLTWEKRAINLDMVAAPSNKVVTGVRFHLTDSSRLTLQIRVTDFNYETGKLENLADSSWISNPTKEKSRLVIDQPDVPIKSPKLSVPNWTINQYVEFGPTDRVKDAAQITVPFLDALLVEGRPSPLSGVGLYYKGQPGYGGFIAPVLIVYDSEPHISNIDS